MSVHDFLKGSWQGEGLVMDFTPPLNTMVFGSMQAANPEGKTAYWETFRFELVDDKIYLYTVTLRKDSGTYISAETSSHQISFKGFNDYDEKVQLIHFESLVLGKLTLGVSGLMEGKQYQELWGSAS